MEWAGLRASHKGPTPGLLVTHPKCCKASLPRKGEAGLGSVKGRLGCWTGGWSVILRRYKTIHPEPALSPHPTPQKPVKKRQTEGLDPEAHRKRTLEPKVAALAPQSERAEVWIKVAGCVQSD